MGIYSYYLHIKNKEGGWRDKDMQGSWEGNQSKNQEPTHRISIYLPFDLSRCRLRRRRIEQEQGDVERIVVDLSIATSPVSIDLEKIVMDTSASSRERSELT